MTSCEILRRCFSEGRVLYSSHARKEMRTEEFGIILDQDIFNAICDAEIIEEYPEDKPYPSVLVLGFTEARRPLHVVCAYDRESDFTIVITAYEPDPGRWDEFRRKRK